MQFKYNPLIPQYLDQSQSTSFLGSLFLKLDQTIPQTVINGRPTFTSGIIAGTTNLTGNLYVGSAADGKNVIISGTLGAETSPALTGATGVNWTFGAGYTTPLAGTIDKTADGVNTITVTGAGATPTAGVTYKVEIVVSALSVAGGAKVIYGGEYLKPLTSTGTFTTYVTASTNGKLIITPLLTATRFTISSISIKALTADTGDLSLCGNLTVCSPSFFQDRVGIGTLTPNNVLQVYAGGGNNYGITITNVGMSTTDHAALKLENTEAISTIYLNSSVSTPASCCGWYTNATNGLLFYPQAKQALRVNGTVSYFYGDGDLGNVGVGIALPAYEFHVANASGEADIAIDSAAANDVNLRYLVAGTAKYNIYYDTSDGDLVFYDNAASAERMRIDSNGFVGIGCNPSSLMRLNIEGNVNNASYVTINNANAGATAYTGYMACNANNDVKTAMRFICMGTNWTTNGAYVQDGGVLAAEENLSGGMSILARGAAASLRFYAGGYADATARHMTILSTGLIGMGVATPLYKLDINGVSTQLHISQDGDDTGAYFLSNGSNSVCVSGGVMFNDTDWVAKSTSASIIAQVSGATYFYGDGGLTAGVAYTPTLRMTIGVDGIVTVANDLLVNGGDIGVAADTDLIQLAANSVTVNGNIATTTLSLVTGQVTNGIQLFSGNANSYTALAIGRTAIEFYLGITDGGNVWTTGSAAGDIVHRTTAGKIMFDTNNGTGTALMTLAGANGSVGIGTTAPSTKLDVVGTGRVSAVTDGSGTFTLNTLTASKQFNLNFDDAGTNKWALYKTTNNLLALWDAAISKNLMVVTTNTGFVFNDNAGAALVSINASTKVTTFADDILVDGGNIGLTADTDLILMSANKVQIQGSLGLGVDPAANLHVYGGGELIRISDSSATGSPYISFYQTTSRRAYIQFLDTGDTLVFASEFGAISFKTDNAGTETERMNISSAGIVTLSNDLLVDGGNIGITADNDLLTLAANLLTVAGNINAASTSIGLWPGGAGYAFVQNTALIATTTSYALLQDNTGNTFINAASGKTLYFRINNSGGATMTSSATVFNTSLSVRNSTGLVLGTDVAAGTPNVAGKLWFFSAGDNAYSTYFVAGEQTANATYTLPTAMPAGNAILQSTNAGVLSWVTAAGDVTAASNLTDNCIVRGDGGAKGVQTTTVVIDDSNNVELPAKITKYNNVATEGYGVPAIVDHVGLTAQSASVAATNYTNAGTAGLYRISYYLVFSALDLSGATVTASIAWTDALGGRSLIGANLNFNGAVQYETKSYYIQSNSGNPTYTLTVVGSPTTGRYNFYSTCERIA